MAAPRMKDVTYDGDKVTEVRWSNKGIKGRLNLQFLPRGIEHFDVSNNEIEGPVDFPRLPPGLVSLDMSNNKIKQRVIKLGEIPSTLEIMDFTGNEIERVVSRATGEPIVDHRVWF